MPKFISIDKSGIAKSHNVEPGYPLLDLYRRVGFKSPESFEQQYVWKTPKYRIVLLAKTKGRTGQNNTYKLPFKWDNMPVLYGSIALLNIGEDGTYLDLDINEWNALCAQPDEAEPSGFEDSDDRAFEDNQQFALKEPEPVIVDKSAHEDKPKRSKTAKKKEPEPEEPEVAEYVEELEEEDYDESRPPMSNTTLPEKESGCLSVPVVEFRSNIATKLAGILDNDDLALKIEKGVYNYAIREAKFNSIVRKWDNDAFMQLYTDRLRTMFINLQTQPEFAARIKSGELDAETIAYMTHQEMNPARWKESIERKIKRDDSKFNAKVEASTDMFECRNWKCKSKRCTYYEMQTRSADEPATVFITCLDCGKHWKM